jgi:hypothetical protein
MATYQEINKTIAENSALLFSITDVPEEFQECKLADEDESYQLPIAREKQLADDFAFISAWTQDGTKVMAVGIEEDADKQGMVIRLASNTGQSTVAGDGLEGIASTLQKAASRSKSKSCCTRMVYRSN